MTHLKTTAFLFESTFLLTHFHAFSGDWKHTKDAQSEHVRMDVQQKNVNKFGYPNILNTIRTTKSSTCIFMRDKEATRCWMFGENMDSFLCDKIVAEIKSEQLIGPYQLEMDILVVRIIYQLFMQGLCLPCTRYVPCFFLT